MVDNIKIDNYEKNKLFLVKIFKNNKNVTVIVTIYTLIIISNILV